MSTSDGSRLGRIQRLDGQGPAANATRRSVATHTVDGKPRGRAESRPGHGPGRRCAHLPDARFPATSPPGRRSGRSLAGARRSHVQRASDWTESLHGRGSPPTAWRLALVLLSLLFFAPLHAQESSDGWRTFEGTWSAVGRRQALPTETGRAAVVTALSGTVTITTAAGLAAGFRAEVIAFDDGAGGGAGRAVWTDSRGDQVFSALRGDPVETGRRIAGTITGGTGRYAGITGAYSLTWQYVVRGEEEAVQGRAVDLKGRFRRAEAPR